MRTLLRGVLRALVCISVLVVSPRCFAGGDNTNAAKIGLDLWAKMNQVMAGVSKTQPGHLPDLGLGIRTPKGIYVIVMIPFLITQANKASKSLGISSDAALTNYFGALLSNPAVSGLLFAVPWNILNPKDPALDATTAYAWNSLDDAFNAIDTWNGNNPTQPPKTLQLAVYPGFNAPQWLLNHLESCDGLFLNPTSLPTESCGYTDIFLATESGTPVAKPLLLPWNATYKSQWRAFLVALNAHIASKPTYLADFVSIAVAGPTSSSEEMILPNNINNKGPLTLPNPAAGHSTASNITAFSAWNCLLANNYGPKSPYLNSNRAFIEEWNAAIDMFGEVFSGITLTVSTGNGLPFPNFPAATTPAVPGCGLSGIALHRAPSLSVPPLGFAPDCAKVRPMDCAAETAILAYFAEPPVGGPNAKATQEDGLAAAGIRGGGLSGGSVKWLSASTFGGLRPLNGNSAVLSRMLSGLQFAKEFSVARFAAQEGCPMGTCSLSTAPKKLGCVSGTGKQRLCSAPPSPEEALYRVLQVFFAGTAPGAAYYGESEGNNTSASFTNAPIDYLQVYWQDILYAGGLANCTFEEIASAPPNTSKCKVAMAAHTTTVNGKNLTAQQMLQTAAGYMPTQPIAAPLFGYSSPNQTAGTYWQCQCLSGYEPRQAFQGDDVCVTPAQQLQAAADNKPATVKSRYKTNATDGVAYGVCKSPYVWRQAYMGDYVCVSASVRAQVAVDNRTRRFRCSQLPKPP